MKKDKTTTSSPNSTNAVLAAVLNWVGFIEMILFTVLLITTVWVDSDVIRKLLTSDLIAFVATLIIYWLCCYEKNK